MKNTKSKRPDDVPDSSGIRYIEYRESLDEFDKTSEKLSKREKKKRLKELNEEENALYGEDEGH